MAANPRRSQLVASQALHYPSHNTPQHTLLQYHFQRLYPTTRHANTFALLQFPDHAARLHIVPATPCVCLVGRFPFLSRLAEERCHG